MKIVLLFFLCVFFSILISITPFPVYGDGFAQETLPATIFGNRTINLFLKINPPVLTSENIQDRYLLFRWFDANTNQTIKHATFLVTVTRHNDFLMENVFHTHTGVLTLKITPSEDPKKWAVSGLGEPNPDGPPKYTPKDNGPMEVVAPILDEGGLYHFHIVLLGLDNDQNQFSYQNAPKYDSYLSVGDISNDTITYQGKTHTMKIISYYDKTSNYNFDSSKLQLSWSMLFDWDLARLNNQPVFVHQEIFIPKSFNEFANSSAFAVTINGNPVPEGRIVIDPYSSSDAVIVHILLNKKDVENLATTISPGIKTMNFSLATKSSNIVTSSNMMTDLGGWKIDLGWNPSNLNANSQNLLRLTFFDAFNEQAVSSDVAYDLKILNKDGSVEFLKANLVAKKGVDSQAINLSTNGLYTLEINIKSIINNGVPDISRVGLARGSLVIPSTVINEKNTGNNTKNPTASNLTDIKLIPKWVKNEARWWSENLTDDVTFVQGIQYLIKEGIIQIPTTSNVQGIVPSLTIPTWIKTDASLWAMNQVPDSEFLKGIQYLIQNGIMKI